LASVELSNALEELQFRDSRELISRSNSSDEFCHPAQIWPEDTSVEIIQRLFDVSLAGQFAFNTRHIRRAHYANGHVLARIGLEPAIAVANDQNGLDWV
jgi:hypothetical protein